MGKIEEFEQKINNKSYVIKKRIRYVRNRKLI